MPRNTFVSKLMFDKLPIADRLHFFDSSESPTCLTCHQSIETQSHLFQCRESNCRKHRLRCWVQQCKVILKVGHTSRIIMDAIDANVRSYLHVPQRKNKWQHHQGNRAVFAAVQRAIVDQNHIGWDKFLTGVMSKQWGFAQKLYQEITGDYHKRIPRTWAETILPALWDFSHNIWTYRNEIKHGVTLAEQSMQRRARVTALVEDRYRHRPHLDAKYKFLFRKPLAAKLEEGNRALYMWLSTVANLSSLSTRPTHQQASMATYTTQERLSDEELGRLRRPMRRLRRLRDLSPASPQPKQKKPFALGVTHPTRNMLLPAMWKITTKNAPTPLLPTRQRQKNFKSSIRSSQANKLWDRGRRDRILS